MLNFTINLAAIAGALVFVALFNLIFYLVAGRPRETPEELRARVFKEQRRKAELAKQRSGR